MHIRDILCCLARKKTFNLFPSIQDHGQMVGTLWRYVGFFFLCCSLFRSFALRLLHLLESLSVCSHRFFINVALFFFFSVGKELIAHRMQMPWRKWIMCNENVLEEFAAVPRHRWCTNEKILQSQKCWDRNWSACNTRIRLAQWTKFKFNFKTVSRNGFFSVAISSFWNWIENDIPNRFCILKKKKYSFL